MTGEPMVAADSAFALLVETSQPNNKKERVVATTGNTPADREPPRSGKEQHQTVGHQGQGRLHTLTRQPWIRPERVVATPGTYLDLTLCPSPNQDELGIVMIILGIILAVAGWLLSIPVLLYLGVILLVIGIVLMVAGSAGHAVGGRRHYY